MTHRRENQILFEYTYSLNLEDFGSIRQLFVQNHLIGFKNDHMEKSFSDFTFPILQRMNDIQSSRIGALLAYPIRRLSQIGETNLCVLYVYFTAFNKMNVW